MDVSSNDLYTVLLCTVRYSMGRMTYMSHEGWQLVVRYAPGLTKGQLERIRKEIYDGITETEARGKTLGMDFDHASWKEGLAKIEAILAERDDTTLG